MPFPTFSDSSKLPAEEFSKILQDCKMISTNRGDTSLTDSQQLGIAVPASKIASLSIGEFVGMVADNSDQKLTQKVFCAEIINSLKKALSKADYTNDFHM